jgi:hypothetical protein
MHAFGGTRIAKNQKAAVLPLSSTSSLGYGSMFQEFPGTVSQQKSTTLNLNLTRDDAERGRYAHVPEPKTSAVWYEVHPVTSPTERSNRKAERRAGSGLSSPAGAGAHMAYSPGGFDAALQSEPSDPERYGKRLMRSILSARRIDVLHSCLLASAPDEVGRR